MKKQPEAIELKCVKWSEVIAYLTAGWQHVACYATGDPNYVWLKRVVKQPKH